MSDHDNDTCPHLVRASLLEAENSRLKAEVERLRASSFVTAVPIEQYERLRKAGDAMVPLLGRGDYHDARINWNAAKEGKQP